MTVDALRNGPVAAMIRRERLIIVLRQVEPQAALLGLVAELADAGARIFEVTVDAPAAEADLTAVRALLDVRTDGPFLVGAGGVLRRSHLEAARRAGADFAAAAALDPLIVATAVDVGVPFVPGAFTPTEVAAAWAAGATFVKLFPASAVGPSYLHDLRGPLPEPELIPTGGINGATAPAFLEAGGVAVGIGGAIIRGNSAARKAIVRAVAAAGSPA